MMNLRSQEGLARFVKSNEGNVAFLRFKRGGLKHGKYSDWDIAVRDREKAVAACETLYGDAWLRIPRQYVIQHYFEWGQCDLLPVFEWNGFEYLDQDTFWDAVETGDDGIPRPALGHDAYIAWMTGLLWGRRFDRRYREFIQLAAREDEARFRECLETSFGRKLGDKLYRIAERGDAAVATHWVTWMRLKLASRRLFRSPFWTAGNAVSHWWCEWKFHRCLPFPWIGLLGPDGSGKSTVIQKLNEKIRMSRLKIFVVHWLPELSLGTTTSHGTVTDPHAQAAKSVFFIVAATLQDPLILVVGLISLLVPFESQERDGLFGSLLPRSSGGSEKVSVWGGNRTRSVGVPVSSQTRPYLSFACFCRDDPFPKRGGFPTRTGDAVGELPECR